MAQNLEVELLKSNRLIGLRDPDGDVRATYRTAKNTLAIVRPPPPPEPCPCNSPLADCQLNLAEDYPAHCQYCYLAGSLNGPSVVKAFANLPQLLANIADYEQPGRVVSLGAS